MVLSAARVALRGAGGDDGRGGMGDDGGEGWATTAGKRQVRATRRRIVTHPAGRRRSVIFACLALQLGELRTPGGRQIQQF